MYYCDGFVCGGEPELQIEIEKVKVLPDMIMILLFKSGEQRLFDATVLEGEAFKPLKNEEVFNTASVEHGIVVWNDGEIDCSPEYMYEHSYEYPADSMVS
mgnify:CR=1 FL=1